MTSDNDSGLPPESDAYEGEVTEPPENSRFVIRSRESVDANETRNLQIKRMFDSSEGLFESGLNFVLYNKLPAGETNVRHVHDDIEKIYYFLSGEAEIDCGPWRKNASAGDFLFFPAAIPHQILNIGSVDLEFIVVASKLSAEAEGMSNGGLKAE